MMKKIMQPCGLHCIKMQDIGVTIGEQNILQHVNLHIHCGTLAAVIGKNGAGKSTLIRAILGDIPHTGTIEFKYRENGHMQKMRIGYVPQSLNIEKKTPISVYDMIASYQSRYPVFWKKSKKLYEKIEEHLTVFKAEELIEIKANCIGCGICTRICPRANYKLTGEGLKCSGICEFCLACVHNCPQKALGLKLPEKNPDARYRHPEISLNQIIRANKQ